MSKFAKGKFTPKNPQKYSGDPTNIIYRSGWELRLFKTLDKNPNVLSWASEEIVVPYISPVDNRYHRYFPDVVVKVKNKDGEIETIMIEVKPLAQTVEPKRPKRKTRRFLEEAVTWEINKAKWLWAQDFCAKRGWKFRLMTERELGISKHK